MNPPLDRRILHYVTMMNRYPVRVRFRTIASAFPSQEEEELRWIVTALIRAGKLEIGDDGIVAVK